MSVTRAQAEQVLAAVVKRYKSYFEDTVLNSGLVLAGDPKPELIENFLDFEGWHVVWEDGPFEWAYRFTMGGVDEEFAAPLHQEFGASKELAAKIAMEQPAELPKRLASKIHVEPTTSYAIGIYPA